MYKNTYKSQDSIVYGLVARDWCVNQNTEHCTVLDSISHIVISFLSVLKFCLILKLI